MEEVKVMVADESHIKYIDTILTGATSTMSPHQV